MVLARKPEGPRRRWDDNISIDCKEYGGRMWPGLIWLRIGKSGDYGNDPSCSIKCWKSLDEVRTY
jgi:hypothetical protein